MGVAHISMVVSNGCAPDPRVLREASWLVNEGHEVTIHAFDRLQNLPAEEIIDGIRIQRHRVGFTPYGGTWSTVRGLSRFRKSVIKSIQHTDLVHCHDADTLAVGVNLDISPVLFDMHDLHHTWLLMGNPNSIFRKILANRFRASMLRRARKCSAIITSSEGFKKWLADYNLDSAVVENRFPKQESIPLPEKFTIGYLGKVREIESFKFLLNALQLINSTNRPRVLIAGDGTASEGVANIIQNAISEGWLEGEIHGSFNERERRKLMKEISVMYAMYPTERGNISEGALPSKMFEAAAFGRPSIVNSNTPMGDLCNSENLGCTVEWGNEKELATTLEIMNGEKVELLHDAERERNRFLTVINELL